MKTPQLPTLGYIRFVAFIATLLVFLLYYLMPERVLELKPHTDLNVGVFADEAWGGKSTAKWLNYKSTEWECTKRSGNGSYPICGGSFGLQDSTTFKTKTLDVSAYDFMYLHLSLGETIDKVKVYLRNHNPLYSTMGNYPSQKPNSVIFKKGDIENNKVKIYFDEFIVSQWWVDEFDIPRHLVKPEFNKITNLSIEVAGAALLDQPQTLRFDKLVLVGKWVSINTLSIIFASIWTIILAVDSCNRIYLLYNRSEINSKRVDHLTHYARTLQKESDKYRELSAIDPLTGVYNRSGLANRVEGVLSGQRYGISIGLIVFDIDHFKNINDSFGHDVGDEILRGLTELVNSGLRESDTLARWGGEEFVVFTVMSADKHITSIGEKIRKTVQKHKFGLDRNRKITVSLGLTIVSDRETFEEAFKRADTALYQAKAEGRNRLIMT